MTYEQIINLIKEEKKISNEEIEAKIKEKLNQLSDLVSKEGAAHIVANELGVNIYQSNKTPRRCKINELMPMMRNIDVIGKVVRLYDIRNFSKNGREGRIGSFLLGDETGKVRIVIWDENLIKKIEINSIKDDSLLLIKNGYIKENNGFREMHLGNAAEIEINPKGEKIGNIASFNSFQPSEIKEIIKLKEGENATIHGTLVNAFAPKYYNACPECNKKVNVAEDKSICAVHGEVVPKQIPIVNIFLDDGTDNIRIVFFRDAAKEALKLNDKEMQELKDNPDKFEAIKEKIMLEQLEITGRVVRNQLFDRLEFIASSVRAADPKKIAAMLKK